MKEQIFKGEKQMQEDRLFAEKINQEYGIPVNELIDLITDIRLDIDFWNSYSNKPSEKLLPKDEIIESITVKTNKGTHLFDGEIAALFTEMLIDYKELSKRILKYSPEYLIWKHFKNSNLGPFQKRVVTGMLYKHLETGPYIKSEDEWKPGLDLSYKHYRPGGE